IKKILNLRIFWRYEEKNIEEIIIYSVGEPFLNCYTYIEWTNKLLDEVHTVNKYDSIEDSFRIIQERRKHPSINEPIILDYYSQSEGYGSGMLSISTDRIEHYEDNI